MSEVQLLDADNHHHHHNNNGGDDDDDDDVCRIDRRKRERRGP